MLMLLPELLETDPMVYSICSVTLRQDTGPVMEASRKVQPNVQRTEMCKMCCISSAGSKHSFGLPAVYCVLCGDAITHHIKEVYLHSRVGRSCVMFLPIAFSHPGGYFQSLNNVYRMHVMLAYLEESLFHLKRHHFSLKCV